MLCMCVCVCCAEWWWAYSSARRLAISVMGRGENEAVYLDGFAGMCTGVCETVHVHPFDSIRARIMTGASAEPRCFDALQHVCRTEGFTEGALPQHVPLYVVVHHLRVGLRAHQEEILGGRLCGLRGGVRESAVYWIIG